MADQPGTPTSARAGTQQNSAMTTLIHNATKKGDIAVLEKLLEEGGNVNAKDEAGWAPIHIGTPAICFVMSLFTPLQVDNYMQKMELITLYMLVPHVVLVYFFFCIFTFPEHVPLLAQLRESAGSN